MSKDNENKDLEFEDPEAFEDKIAAEVLEEMAANNPDPEPEPEPETPEPEETDDDTDEEIPESPEEDTGTEPDADDVAVQDEVSDDAEDVDAFREEFASQRGFDVESVADLSIDQMERLGRNLDKQILDRVQQQQPEQPAQQNFNQQFQPQPQHLQPHQQHWQQPQPQPQQPVDLEALKKQAEDEGYDPEFIKALEITHQQNVQLQQQQQWHQQQIEQQQFEQNQAVINSFDQNLDNLKVTGLFGESKQSAAQNPLQFQARANLFNQSLAFSQQTGQPLDSNLIGRVAQLLYPEQFNKQQRKSLAQKAMKQHKNKLGSSKSGNAPKMSNPKVNKIADEYGDEVAGVLNDPEIRNFISSASPD